MALIGMHDVSWGFGEPALLAGIGLQIEKGERVGLLGRNGVGKSSLFRLLTGEIRPDSGEIIRQQGVQVSLLEQEVPSEYDGTVLEVVARGLGATGAALADFHRLGQTAQDFNNPAVISERDRLQHLLDTEGGWGLLK